MGTGSSGRVIAGIAAVMVVLSAGLLAYALKTGTPLHYVDERDYVDIARNVADGNGFQLVEGSPTAYRPPAWPLLIAGFLLIGVPTSMLVVIPATAMIAAAVVAAVIGVRITRSPWGAGAGIAVLGYPINVYSAVTMYPQAFATFLILLAWWMLLCVTGPTAVGGGRGVLLRVGIGLTAAVLALSVPTLAATGLVVLGWLVWVSRGQRLRSALLAGAGFIVPIAVWVIRNALTFGAPIPLSSSTGLNLLIGNNPTATGSSGTDVDIVAALQAASRLGEAEADAYLRDAAIDWVIAHPADAAALYWSKLLNYFSPYNAPVTATDAVSAQRLIAYTAFAVLVALVVTRLALWRRLPLAATEKLFLAIFLLNAPVMAVFFTRTRFRQPLDNILLIEVAVAVAVVIGLVAGRRRGRGSPLRAGDDLTE